MKFGKRLSVEASRCWMPFYFDYKAAKKSIRHDIERKDAHGRAFDAVMTSEMQKISSFYIEKVEELDAIFKSRDGAWEPDDLTDLMAEIQALKKFATLNYIAVYKAVKKRNRHLLEAFPGLACSTEDAVALLQKQRFFTSNKLATLFTWAQVLQSELQAGSSSYSSTIEEFSCPICLQLLQNPVVLTCAHRFCWGCVVTDSATRSASGQAVGAPHTDVKSGSSSDESGKDDAKSQQTLSAQLLCYASSFEDSRPYECPCCRKVQFLDLNSLQVDQHLSKFVEELTSHENPDVCQPKTGKASARGARPDSSLQEAQGRLRADAKPFVPSPADKIEPGKADVLPVVKPACATTATRPQEEAAVKEAQRVSNAEEEPREAEFLLPPLDPSAGHKMTVVLDMDGTLLSSFSAKRSPVLPPGLNTFITGKGGNLNPGGVLVVERPGLRKFLQDLSTFAEIVLFTAGVPEYAEPIIQQLDPSGTIFQARLFRGSTVKSRHYPCVKDMCLLGRDLRKTVLVDDTPLAFLHQPNNGIPIFAFRSDPDDRFLSEAVLPLLQSLSVEEDVRPVVSKRFGMVQWFARNGFGLPQHKADGIGRDEVAAKRISVTAARNARGEGECPEMTRASEILLLMDFDKTMTLADAGESLIGQLAPELLPLLDGLEMPAPFVEATNGILAEMQRRGISRDLIVSTLRDLGQRLIPDETRRAVSLATRRGADVRILSDCNTVFISHMLSGAKIRNHVKEIISNSSAFERAGDLDEPQERNDKTMAWSSHGPKAASHRLVITPRHDRDGGCDHGCSLCPHNLCKGLELRLLRDKLGYGRIVYCGDGANDICPTLQLLEGDFVCVRKGHSLEYLCRERMSEIKADVHFWEDHRELLAIIDRVVH